MHPVLLSKRNDIDRVCREHGVARLEVFGSAARGGDFDELRSDVDFLVEFKQVSAVDPLGQFFGLEQALAEAVGRKIDLIEAGEIRNRYVKQAIDRDRRTVYAA